MTLVRPVVSVIIPTHDRRAALERLLGALGAQTYPSAFLEVIVVADGCRDGTADMLRQYPPPPFRLKLVELPGSGAAAARNRGSAEATGALLVFLDDDIEPGPGLIDAHVRAHGDGADALGIGRLIFPEEQERSLFRIGLRAWWEEQFLIMRQPGHRFSYRDIFAGNCSVSAGLFARLGGFDAALPRRQDGEFGFRVMQAGGAVTFAEDAIGYHHDESDVVGSWRRAHDEGRGDILMGRRHPEVRADLLLARFDGPLRVRDRLVRALAFGQPSVGDAAASLLGRRLLPLAERLRWRRLWGRLFFGLRTYWYLRGAARELGSRAALSQFLHGGSARGDQDGCETEVDLDEGLVAAERRLDRDRPAAVRLCCRGRVVGRIPARVGAERLRGAHLRPMLATQLASAQVAPPVMAATWTTGGDMAIRVLDREVTEGAAPIRGAEHCDCLYTLVRYRGEPIGWLLVRNPGRQPTISPDREAEAMEEQLGEALAVAVLKEQVSERPALDAALPPISVVVCTRDRADLLAGCLEAIRALDYPHYEVIVVDNAPADARTANLTAGLAVRYVCERRPGLDWARNRGIAEARHGIVAFVDDDARPDRGWLRAIGQAFAQPEVMCVTGFVAPAELETDAQRWFEFAYGGMGKGFRRATFSAAHLGTRDLLRSNAFGVGTNMAFRREVFEHLRWFDVALDAGTPAGGAGDLDMFHRVVTRGYLLVYEPRAIVWHRHRRSAAQLRQQLYDNGRSYGAYLLTCARNGTVSRMAALRFAAIEWFARGLLARLLRPRGLPRTFSLAELQGALWSPLAYRAAQARARELLAATGSAPPGDP